jgi:hypothetical protein
VCKGYTTPVPNLNGHPVADHEQALKLYLEGNGLRGIGRLLRVVHQTVANWLTVAHAQLSGDVPQPTTSAVTELDELYTFVSQKKTRCMWSQLWIALRGVLWGMQSCPNDPLRYSKRSLNKDPERSIISVMDWRPMRMSIITVHPMQQC